jgi:hypothetical protein
MENKRKKGSNRKNPTLKTLPLERAYIVFHQTKLTK